jgi:hypothetical protein
MVERIAGVLGMARALAAVSPRRGSRHGNCTRRNHQPVAASRRPPGGRANYRQRERDGAGPGYSDDHGECWAVRAAGQPAGGGVDHACGQDRWRSHRLPR